VRAQKGVAVCAEPLWHSSTRRRSALRAGGL